MPPGKEHSMDDKTTVAVGRVKETPAAAHGMGVSSSKQIEAESFVFDREDNDIYFGQWPQSLKDPSVGITEEQDERGYYLGTDGAYYAKVVAPSEGELEVYTFLSGEEIQGEGTYYFKVEPLKWRILQDKDGVALILCDRVIASLDAWDFSEEYKDSEVRTWLNGTFFKKAFNRRQQQIILTTPVDNSRGSLMDFNAPYLCETTTDRVFLLSEEDVFHEAYGFSSDLIDGDARKLAPSDYAKALGVYEADDGAAWWLRTPDCLGDRGVMCVSCDGTDVDWRNVDDGTPDFDDGIGVAPAIQLDQKDGFLSPLYEWEDDYIYFGEYPQTIKEKDVIIQETMDDRGYYLGSDGAYYAKATGNPGRFEQVFSNGEGVSNGEEYYFKVEPIRWRVLADEGKYFYLLCDSVIDKTVYAKSGSNCYADSDIRAWLNGEFLKLAFTEEQRELIPYTQVENEEMSALWEPLEIPDRGETQDKLFLLSRREVTAPCYGFDSRSSALDGRRVIDHTDYAMLGAFRRQMWALRSLRSDAETEENNEVVCPNGELLSYAYSECPGNGVVPALHILIKSEKQAEIDQTYIVTLRSKGGSCEEKFVTAKEGRVCKLPTPVRYGYTFDGWYDVNGKAVLPDSKWTRSMGTTLVAKWSPEEVIITLDAAKGMCNKKTIRAKWGLKCTYPTPVRQGYTFRGWYDQKGEIYIGSENWYLRRDITLTARWEENQYTVSFDATGGVCPITTMRVGSTTHIIKLPKATRQGYIFLGWSTSNVPNSVIHETEAKNILKDVTFYAQWAKKKKPYTTAYINGAEYFYIGEYPQSPKADGVTITTKQNKYGYYLGSDKEYYAKVVTKDEEGVTHETYYKVEPLRWKALGRQKKNVTVICETIIDWRIYGEQNRYAKSDIRRWLNKDFYRAAFTSREKSAIVRHKVDNRAKTTGYVKNQYAGGKTKDRIFLPCQADLSQVCYMDFPMSEYAKTVRGGDHNRIGDWWTRSPITAPQQARVAGIAGVDRGGKACNTPYGVVPMMVLERTRGDASGGKPTGEKKKSGTSSRRGEPSVGKGLLFSWLTYLLFMVLTIGIMRLMSNGIGLQIWIANELGFSAFFDTGSIAFVPSIIVALIIGFMVWNYASEGGADNGSSLITGAISGGAAYFVVRAALALLGYVIAYAVRYVFLLFAIGFVLILKRIRKKRYAGEKSKGFAGFFRVISSMIFTITTLLVVMIGYLMTTYGMTLGEAYELIEYLVSLRS